MIRTCIKQLCSFSNSRLFLNNFRMSSTSAQNKLSTFVLFGDSLTQFCFSPDGCWGAQLADLLQRKCDVLNRGYSGYNSRWCKIMLPQIITADMAKNVAGFTIFLGANDSNDGDKNPEQHVPLDEFKANLLHMIQYLQSLGIGKEKIILISAPVYDNDAWKVEMDRRGKPTSKTMETTKLYADGCLEVAKETGVWSVDLYTEMFKNQNWKELLVDGLHFSADGSKLLFQLLQPIIEKLTEDIKPTFPAWDEVDSKNPSESFK